MSQSLENISNLLLESPSFFILPSSKRNAGKLTILFSSAVAARELAYMLRGDWDGVNAVIIYQPDAIAVKNALDLLRLELGQEEVEYCQAGERCTLLIFPSIPLFSKARSGKSVLMAEFLLLQEALEESIANRRTRSS